MSSRPLAAPLVALLLAAACAAGEPAPTGVHVAPEPPADPTAQADWLIDFPTTEAGQQATFALTIDNDTRRPLQLDRLPLLPPFHAEPANGATIAARKKQTLHLRFTPVRPGDWESVVPLSLGEQTRWIRLRGSAVPPPPGACELEARATALPFGKVGQRAAAVRHVLLHNPSAYACTAELHIEGPETFAVPATLELLPGADVQVPITLKPAALGATKATLHVASPTAGSHTVQLTATVVARCLEGPAALDFATADEGCWSELASARLRNVCDHPVELRAVEFTSDPASSEFRMIARPNLPLQIQPGDAATAVVQYTPRGETASTDTLLVEDDAGEPLAIPLSGDVNPRDPVVNVEVQGWRPDADRLYVVDDGSHMEDLADALQGWALGEFVTLNELDARVGITTTSRTATEGCPGSGADGRILPFDSSAPRVLDRPELLDRRLEERLPVAACSEAPNEAFLAAERAVAFLASRYDDPDHPERGDGNSGLRREDVPLQIVFVTASDDASGGVLEAWMDRFQELAQEFDLTFAAVLGDGASCEPLPLGHRIEGLVRGLGGKVHHVCSQPKRVAWTPTTPFWRWSTQFLLRDEPLDRNRDGAVTEEGDGFELRVNGIRLPQIGDDGALRYEVLPNVLQVQFAPKHAPLEGSRLEFEFLTNCER